MLTPQLITYLTTCKNRNIEFRIIADLMAKQGWIQEDISLARDWYQNHQTPNELSTVNQPQPYSNQVVNQPQSENSQTVTNTHHKSKTKRWGILFGCLIVFTILLLSGAASLITYGNVNLPSSALKNQVSFVVQSIPFMPKTPLYVLEKSLLADKMQTANVDLSIAASMPTYSVIESSQNFDLSIKGPLEFIDEQNPKAHLVILSKDLAGELTVINQKLYLKVSQVPEVLPLMFNLPESVVSALQNQWFYIDQSTLDTEARQTMDQYLDTQDLENKDLLQKQMEKIMEIVQPHLVMEKETLESIPTYKISLDMTPELITQIERIFFPSKNSTDTELPLSTNFEYQKYLKTFTITLWYDQKQYYLQKLSVLLDINTDLYYSSLSTETESSTFTISTVINFKNINLPVTIIEPTEAKPLESAYQILLYQNSNSELQNQNLLMPSL